MTSNFDLEVALKLVKNAKRLKKDKKYVNKWTFRLGAVN